MSFEHKPNRGSLFRNDRKDKESAPDYKGDALINGREVWVSGWLNDGKNGKYLSLSFQDKDKTHQQGVAQVREETGFQEESFDANADIPF